MLYENMPGLISALAYFFFLEKKLAKMWVEWARLALGFETGQEWAPCDNLAKSCGHFFMLWLPMAAARPGLRNEPRKSSVQNFDKKFWPIVHA